MEKLRPENRDLLLRGCVIPAHPLALDARRQLDEERQRLLTRYYMAAGAGGIAVGVHTTQFEIHDPATGLYSKVLSIAAEEVKKARLGRPFIKIAGVSGPTEQALEEARLAKSLEYDLALVSMNGLGHWTEQALLERIQKIGELIPLFGFYLQPAVGGRVLSIDFWRNFAEIPNAYAIKIAPFNRYQTLDVVRAVCLSSRREEIALYTGNDDNILLDLLTTFKIKTPNGLIEKDIVGGLLGHWAVWTSKAVSLLNEVHAIKTKGGSLTPDLLSENIKITDANAAFFDAQNNFKGCIAGIHEVLRRQGILKGIWCLNPKEKLSPGQMEQIDRVYLEYPDLNDDDFAKAFLFNERMKE